MTEHNNVLFPLIISLHCFVLYYVILFNVELINC